jgi:hypothetical protein
MGSNTYTSVSVAKQEVGTRDLTGNYSMGQVPVVLIALEELIEWLQYLLILVASPTSPRAGNSSIVKKPEPRSVGIQYLHHLSLANAS